MTAPVIVAYIGRLVGDSDYSRARDLLGQFPANSRSPTDDVVAYLRFLTNEPPRLSGTSSYHTLTPEDLFLGACYYDQPSSSPKQKLPPASPILKEQLQWDYQSLKHALSDGKEGSDTLYLNTFKVAGLQPRIAELAFHEVYGRLHGVAAANRLCDLNIECVKQLVPPWRLDSRPRLPAADWEDGHKQRYDVKCNLFYRTKQAKVGLRGFFITRSEVPNHTFPGFVFTESNGESCSWVYVGEYQPVATLEQLGDRVFPSVFGCRTAIGTSCPEEIMILLWACYSLRIPGFASAGSSALACKCHRTWASVHLTSCC